MSEYTLSVGLEVHAELSTHTKMFCDSKNDTDERRPNVNVCPVCMGYPGTLPVINIEAVRSVLRLGTAVGGEIGDYTEFDRKNYFYPDIPKGYQISQYKHPLVKGGSIAGVELTRIHLEEDTAKSSHPEGSSREESLLDFNRAGVPLLELVTEPVIHDAARASKFAKELQLLLLYLGISHANLEKGEMRIEANISISKDNKLGNKVEVKNLNSFRSVEKAIEFEVNRHKEILEGGGQVVQETRGWDENRGETFSQRVKEEAHDYRYFPDPDLPKLFISEIAELSPTKLKNSLPELPEEKRARFTLDFGLKDDDIENYIRDEKRASFFESVAQKLDKKELYQLASNYITSDLKKFIEPKDFVDIIIMIDEGMLSSRGAKDVLKIIQESGGSPKEIAEENNLIQVSNTDELEKIAKAIIARETKVVNEYKSGKLSSLQYLVGQAMKETKGSGNPKILKNIFERLIA